MARGGTQALARTHAARHRRAHPSRLPRPARPAQRECCAFAGRGRRHLGRLQAARNLEEPGAALRDGEALCGHAGAQRSVPLRELEEVQEVLRLSMGGSDILDRCHTLKRNHSPMAGVRHAAREPDGRKSDLRCTENIVVLPKFDRCARQV